MLLGRYNSSLRMFSSLIASDDALIHLDPQNVNFAVGSPVGQQRRCNHLTLSVWHTSLGVMLCCCSAEEAVSPSKQAGSPSKQQAGTFGGLFGGGGEKGSGGQAGSGAGAASSWLPTWAGGAKKAEEKVLNAA